VLFPVQGIQLLLWLVHDEFFFSFSPILPKLSVQCFIWEARGEKFLSLVHVHTLLGQEVG
jgi:hypothetical protein